MPVHPSRFDATPPYELLREVEMGRLGFDCRLIRSLEARREETIAALGRLIREERGDQRLDIGQQIFDLYRRLRTMEAVPFLVREAARAGEEVSDEVIAALLELGPGAADAVLREYERADRDERREILFLLAALRAARPRIDELIAGVIEEDPYEGALLAGLYGQPGLRQALEAALKRMPAQARFERQAVEQAIEALETPASPPQFEPFDIYAQYPEESLPEFEVLSDEELAEFLESEDEEWRAGAALSLVDSDYGDALLEKLLKAAAGDESARVRAACYRALGERGDERARALLRGVLRSKEVTLNERAGAVIGLAGEADDPEVHRAILRLYETPESRAAALEAMWRALDERYRDYFPANLHSEDPEVRRQAVQGVGLYEISSSVIELVPLMQDEETRKTAVFAYAMAAPVKGRFSVKDGERLLERIEELADGLSRSEYEAVASALDLRLARAGRKPVFGADAESEPEGEEQETAAAPRGGKVGRNDPCPCGSGKKYKKCCGAAQ
jgi:HEAT repeat protein